LILQGGIVNTAECIFEDKIASAPGTLILILTILMCIICRISVQYFPRN